MKRNKAAPSRARIIERQQAEETLRESKDRLARAEAFSHIMVTHLGLDGCWLKVPPALCSLLGYSEKELLASTIQDVMHPEDREADWSQYQRLLRSELKSFSSTKRCLHQHGQVVWLDVHCALVTDREGQPVHFLAYLRDVTQSKQAEEQVREQARLLHLAQDAILVCDLESCIQFWNQGAQRLYGWTAAEAAGRKLTELCCKDATAFTAAKERLLETGQWAGELSHLTKDRQELAVSSRWTLVCDTQGKPKAILVINTDITEQKKMEARFLRVQRMECIGTLASGVAHDLNNILAPILMSASMLREGLPPSEAENLLALIEASAQRGAAIVKQMLSFGRGVSNERVLVQARHLLRDLLRMAQETFPKAITLSWAVPADLWPLLGDGTQLHQVLLNLFVNARDAMPEGGRLTLAAKNIRLTESDTSAHLEAKTGPYVLFQVSDTGHGIPPGIIDQIFEPFFTTKEYGEGTGLGLSTVRGIVKSHGGFVRVRSQVGQGSTFEVYLPASPDAEPLAAPSAPLALPRGQGELILLVDDEAAVCETTHRILVKHGYAVVTASNGAKALAQYAQHRNAIKLVLTDLMMPVMDGVAMTRVLKKIYPHLKIIIFSGWNQETKKAELRKLGVNTFLPKPSTADQLLNAVHGLLSVAEPEPKDSEGDPAEEVLPAPSAANAERSGNVFPRERSV